MRLPKLLMGSLLAVPLACAGDDGSNVDTGNDTGSGTGTPSTMSMTAADDDGVDDDGVDDGVDDDGGNTTGGPPGGSSGEPPADGSSSGEPPADSSGSGGSDTGGGVSAECMAFCDGFFEVCGEHQANDYVDEGTCHTECEGYEQAEFECKVQHLMNAANEGLNHCAHANIDGGGVC